MVFGFGKKDKKKGSPAGEEEGDTASPGETPTTAKPTTPAAGAKQTQLDEDGRDVNDMTLPTEDSEKKKGRCSCCKMACCKCGRKTPEERARIQVRCYLLEWCLVYYNVLNFFEFINLAL